MHSRTLESLVAIGSALAIDLVAYSSDGDPLALVEIGHAEAARLVSLPPAMGQVFRAVRRQDGRAEVAPEAHPRCRDRQPGPPVRCTQARHSARC